MMSHKIHTKCKPLATVLYGLPGLPESPDSPIPQAPSYRIGRQRGHREIIAFEVRTGTSSVQRDNHTALGQAATGR